MPEDFIFDRSYYSEASLDVGDSANNLATKYQHTDLHDFINGFLISYVGEDKIIRKANRTEVAFFSQRGLQELSYDTLKSIKAQEFEVPNNLSFILPKDYVNYVKLSSVDADGIHRIIYPERRTSNAFRIQQDSNGFPDFDTGDNGANDGGGPDGTNDVQRMRQVPTTVITCTISAIPATTPDNPIYRLTAFTTGSASDARIGLNAIITRDNSNPVFNPSINTNIGIININTAVSVGGNVSPIVTLNEFIGAGISETISFGTFESTSLTNFRSPNSNITDSNISYDPAVDNGLMDVYGRRYGIESERAQVNGTYYIDDRTGRIRFASGLVGKTVVLEYISDSLGSEYEMKVHKFAEEALYKHVQYNLASVRSGIPAGILAMLKKEARAAKRQAKLRLSNFKIEEFAQALRNQNKFIKH
mgnify:FL=1